MIELSRTPRANRRARSDAMASSARAERRGIQIGPRIRVGGSVGRIGQNVKNAVVKAAKDTGHTVGEIASNPLVQYATAAALAATGVGAPAAAAILAAEKGGGALLKPGGNIGEGIKGGVEGAAMGYGAAKLGAAVRTASGALSGAGGGSTGTGSGLLNAAKSLYSGSGTDAAGTHGLAGDLAGKVGSIAGIGGGGAPQAGTSALDQVLQTANVPGSAVFGAAAPAARTMSTLDKVLMAANIGDSALQHQQQTKLQNEAVSYAKGAYDANAPVRDQSRAALLAAMGPSAPTPDFTAQSANPYTRRSGYLLGARTPVPQAGV